MKYNWLQVNHYDTNHLLVHTYMQICNQNKTGNSEHQHNRYTDYACTLDFKFKVNVSFFNATSSSKQSQLFTIWGQIYKHSVVIGKYTPGRHFENSARTIAALLRWTIATQSECTLALAGPLILSLNPHSSCPIVCSCKSCRFWKYQSLARIQFGSFAFIRTEWNNVYEASFRTMTSVSLDIIGTKLMNIGSGIIDRLFSIS